MFLLQLFLIYQFLKELRHNEKRSNATPYIDLGPDVGGSDLTKGSADMYNVPTLTTDFGFWQTCLV